MSYTSTRLPEPSDSEVRSLHKITQRLYALLGGTHPALMPGVSTAPAAGDQPEMLLHKAVKLLGG